MKGKYLKKWMSVFLSTALATSSISGCGNSDKEPTDSTDETGNLDFKPFLPAKCRNTQEINDISTLFYTPFHPVLHYSLYQGYSPPLNPEGYRETNISKGSL